MLSSVFSAGISGIDGFLVTVECNSRQKKFAFDIVITHTAPSFCELQNKNFLLQFAASDDTLLDDVRAERATMDALYDRLRHDAHPLTHWLYGHFHQSWHSHVDGVMFSMLDVMEFREVW